MSSDPEEDDYMKLEIKEEQDDTERNRNNKRLAKQSLNSVNESKKVKAARELDQILNKEISQDNKGYKMLQKMGWSKGIKPDKEPIQFTMKEGKEGLGEKRKLGFTTVQQKKVVEKEFTAKKSEYVESSKDKHAGNMLENDLRKVRKTAQSLDETNDRPRNSFWPSEEEHKLNQSKIIDGYSSLVATKVEENPFEDQPKSDQFEAVNFYLRSRYNYCIFCSIQYDDFDDIKKNCPGDTREEHDDD